MYKVHVPTLEILVAGDAGSGKANFINRFLKKFPPSAEVCRKSGMVHFIYNPGKNLKIQLYDVGNVEDIDRSAYGKMDVVLFYYAAHDPESFQSLDKWIGLMGVEVGKEVHSVLVADWSKVGNRDEVERLAGKANKLKDSFGIKLSVQGSFEDEESASSAFEAIMKTVSPPKVNEMPPFNNEEYCQKLFKSDLDQRKAFEKEFNDYYSDEISKPSSSNCGERNSEDMPKLESNCEGLVV